MPHLDEAAKKELWASIPPHQRDARSRGEPVLGIGQIYPIAQDDIMVDPFDIPKTWPRAYGMDVGWNWTAAVWMAWDQQNDTSYLYREYKRGLAEPVIHAHAIKSHAPWMWGVIDPSSQHRSQVDGSKLIDIYAGPDGLGLNLAFADNAVEAGIQSVWQRLSDGRLKVFSNLTMWFDECRSYHRSESKAKRAGTVANSTEGKISKTNDHLMDATRYLILSGFQYVSVEPTVDDLFDRGMADAGRSSVTGY